MVLGKDVQRVLALHRFWDLKKNVKNCGSWIRRSENRVIGGPLVHTSVTS